MSDPTKDDAHSACRRLRYLVRYMEDPLFPARRAEVLAELEKIERYLRAEPAGVEG